jgi:hypothetical protein
MKFEAPEKDYTEVELGKERLSNDLHKNMKDYMSWVYFN